MLCTIMIPNTSSRKFSKVLSSHRVCLVWTGAGVLAWGRENGFLQLKKQQIRINSLFPDIDSIVTYLFSLKHEGNMKHVGFNRKENIFILIDDSIPASHLKISLQKVSDHTG
jgi:hypothetical protein